VTDLPCVFYRPGEVQSATFASQDVGLTAWGFGVTGVSATVLLRARADLAGEFEWPRSDDPFDAVLAYAQYNRGTLRARLGRQLNVSGLGYAGYDGLNLLVEPRRAYPSRVTPGGACCAARASRARRRSRAWRTFPSTR
jgi:hypothetical protein